MLTASYGRNYERNGVEIKFSRMPAESVRKELLEKKWRYSGYSKLWYIFYTESNYLYAARLCNRINRGAL